MRRLRVGVGGVPRAAAVADAAGCVQWVNWPPVPVAKKAKDGRHQDAANDKRVWKGHTIV